MALQNPASECVRLGSNKGQYICVDPISKLVMVQTAVEAPGADSNDEAWALWSALNHQLR